MPTALARLFALTVIPTITTWKLLMRLAARSHPWMVESHTLQRFGPQIAPVFAFLALLHLASVTRSRGWTRRLIHVSWAVLFAWSILVYGSPMCYSSGVMGGLLPPVFAVCLLVAAWLVRV